MPRRQVRLQQLEGRQRAPLQYQRRRPADSAHRLERHVLLRDRRRDRPQRARRPRHPGRGRGVRARHGHRRAAARRAIGPHRRPRTLKAQLHEDDARRPSPTATGSPATTSTSRSARADGRDAAAARERLRRVRQRRHGVRAEARAPRCTDQVDRRRGHARTRRASTTRSTCRPTVRDPILEGLVGVTSQDEPHRRHGVHRVPRRRQRRRLRPHRVAGGGQDRHRRGEGRAGQPRPTPRSFAGVRPREGRHRAAVRDGGGARAVGLRWPTPRRWCAKVFDAARESNGVIPPPLNVARVRSAAGSCRRGRHAAATRRRPGTDARRPPPCPAPRPRRPATTTRRRRYRAHDVADGDGSRRRLLLPTRSRAASGASVDPWPCSSPRSAITALG